MVDEEKQLNFMWGAKVNRNTTELLQDEEFWKKILKISDEKEILNIFKENGSDLKAEELMEIKKYIEEMAQKIKSLNESELESITGGIFKKKPEIKSKKTNIVEGVKYGVSSGLADATESIAGSFIDYMKRVCKVRHDKDSFEKTRKKIEEQKNYYVAQTIGAAAILATLFCVRKGISIWWKISN